MARPRQKNLVERLADAGEEAVHRLGHAPGADRVLGAVNSLRERTDEMQKRLRGLEALEKRLASVEGRLDKLEGKKAPTARRSSAARKRTTAKRTTTASRTRRTSGTSGGS